MPLAATPTLKALKSKTIYDGLKERCPILSINGHFVSRFCVSCDNLLKHLLPPVLRIV